MTRTDIHRPSAIQPAEYNYVAPEHIKIEGLGDVFYAEAMRKRIREHMASTGGTYSSHEHGGNCMVCGSVNAVYTILFHHVPTNSYVRLGQDCAQKMDMGYDENECNAFRKAIGDAREAQAGKRKAAALLADEGLTNAWDLYVAGSPKCTCEWSKRGSALPGEKDYYRVEVGLPAGPCTCPRWLNEEMTVSDIVGKLVKYGSISPKQYNFLRSLMDRISRRAEIQAKREAEKAAAANCPEGRVTVTGVVLSVKVYESQFGDTTKMFVKAAEGYTVFCTVPSGLDVERGATVTFTATITAAPNDPKHGFGKRPVAGAPAPKAPRARKAKPVNPLALSEPNPEDMGFEARA